MKRKSLLLLAVVAVAALFALAANAAQVSKALELVTGNLQLLDNKLLYFGTDNDTSAGYDTTDGQGELGGPWAFTLDSDTVPFYGGIQVLDDKRIYLGTDNNASMYYDEATNDVAMIEGNWVFATTNVPVVFAGGATIDDDKALTLGDDGDWVCAYDEAGSNNLECTALVGTSSINVLTGNLAVGNGTPGTAAMNGEDAYIEGQLEVDGAAQLDGAVTAASLTVSGSVRMTAPGWVAAAGANTSCVTTCGISKPVMAFDAGTTALVALDSATADSCYCDGPTS